MKIIRYTSRDALKNFIVREFNVEQLISNTVLSKELSVKAELSLEYIRDIPIKIIIPDDEINGEVKNE